jgi:glycosyltransferase involved in cell wall biosynthesis
MRILLVRDNTYRPPVTQGSGKMISDEPSGSSGHQLDLLAKGLAEKGHEVFYHIRHTKETIAPNGIQLVYKPIENMDIVHFKVLMNKRLYDFYKARKTPMLATNHGYWPGVFKGCPWVSVSKTHAHSLKQKLYVWNGLDPDNFIYSDQKQDYYLFIAHIKDYLGKGLMIALKLAQQRNLKLIVAGSSKRQYDIDNVQALCDEYRATYVGDVRGIQKSRLFAGAKALISPSQLPETFGITLTEALFSGTPVICSNKGAYGEIMTKEVAFVCKDEADYHYAIDNIENIDSETCRDYAMNNFHYRIMTEKYLEIYEETLARKAQHA